MRIDKILTEVYTDVNKQNVYFRRTGTCPAPKSFSMKKGDQSCNLAAPKAPEIKLPGEIGDLFPNKDKDNDKDNTNGGTEQTGDPSIPKTGGSIMTICFSLAATAALAGGAMLAKKKSEEE